MAETADQILVRPGAQAKFRPGSIEETEQPPNWLPHKGSAELLFFRFGVLLQPANIDGELLLQRFRFLEIPGLGGLRDLGFQEQFALGNACFERRIDVRDLRLLLVGQCHTRRLFLQALHRQFIGRFHRFDCSLMATASKRIEQFVAAAESVSKLALSMATIRLISTDFDGTLVAHGGDPMLDSACLEHIAQLQKQGAAWAINTGRSVDLLESGLADLDFPIHPDFILTSERDIFRPSPNRGAKWEPFGDWNERVARKHAELFHSAEAVLAEVGDFVTHKTKARLLYHSAGLEGLIAENEAELDRVTEFIDRAREKQPKFHYQRNTVYLRFCHVDYHKGAALAELARLLEVPRENIFASGDHHNDISMLDGKVAAMPSCPANAIQEVREAVRNAGGYVAKKEYGAGVHEALLHFANGLR